MNKKIVFIILFLSSFLKLLLSYPHQPWEGRPGCQMKKSYLFVERDDNPVKPYKKMHDLIFKNQTSNDRTRRAISSCETVERQGMRTVIRRHFIYKAIEIKDNFRARPLSQIYIRRDCNSVKHQERFFCRIKASLYAKCNGRLFLILFGHSLKIDSVLIKAAPC